MKLVKDDIKNIDTYLSKNGIKYMDVRYELMDHLITEYESIDNYPNLESFLHRRLGWCKDVAEKKAKTIHWCYQRALWKRVLILLKKPVFIIFSAILIFSAFQISNILENDFFFKIMIFTLISLYAVHFMCIISLRLFKKKEKQLLSMVYLYNILSLPLLLLSIFNLLKDFFLENRYLFMGYWFFVFLIHFAAFIEVRCRRKQVLRDYKFLKQI